MSMPPRKSRSLSGNFLLDGAHFTLKRGWCVAAQFIIGTKPSSKFPSLHLRAFSLMASTLLNQKRCKGDQFHDESCADSICCLFFEQHLRHIFELRSPRGFRECSSRVFDCFHQCLHACKCYDGAFHQTDPLS